MIELISYIILYIICYLAASGLIVTGIAETGLTILECHKLIDFTKDTEEIDKRYKDYRNFVPAKKKKHNFFLKPVMFIPIVNVIYAIKDVKRYCNFTVNDSKYKEYLYDMTEEEINAYNEYKHTVSRINRLKFFTNKDDIVKDFLSIEISNSLSIINYGNIKKIAKKLKTEVIFANIQGSYIAIMGVPKDKMNSKYLKWDELAENYTPIEHLDKDDCHRKNFLLTITSSMSIDFVDYFVKKELNKLQKKKEIKKLEKDLEEYLSQTYTREDIQEYLNSVYEYLDTFSKSDAFLDVGFRNEIERVMDEVDRTIDNVFDEVDRNIDEVDKLLGKWF